MQAAIFIKPDLFLIHFNYGLNKLTHQSLTLEIEYGSVILIIRKVLVLVLVQLEEHNNCSGHVGCSHSELKNLDSNPSSEPKACLVHAYRP